jgi:hypothetical protein
MSVIAKKYSVATVVSSEDIGFTDARVKWVSRIKFIRGFQLFRTAWADSAVAEAVVVQNSFEFVVSRSVHFPYRAQLVIEVLLIFASDAVVGFAVPKNMFSTRPTVLAQVVTAFVRGSQFSSMQSVWRSDGACYYGLLSAFLLG